MTSLMPETIEPATGGSAGGPGGTLPLPKAKKPKRKVWGEADVAAAVTAFHMGERYEGRFTMEEANDKLIKLGLVPKPAKASMHAALQDKMDHLVREVGAIDEEHRPLAARYLAKRLGEFLPKRAK